MFEESSSCESDSGSDEDAQKAREQKHCCEEERKRKLNELRKRIAENEERTLKCAEET